MFSSVCVIAPSRGLLRSRTAEAIGVHSIVALPVPEIFQELR